MKPSQRDPRDGWWSPEFRAWLRALERGASADELRELDALAIAAGDRLRAEAVELLAVDERGRSFVVARTPPELELGPVDGSVSASASTSPFVT